MKLNLRWLLVVILMLAVATFAFAFREDLLGKKVMNEHSFDIEKYLVAGRYEKFDSSKLAFAEDKKVILFFSASWCPSCSMFNEEISEVATLWPDNVLVLYVDYDDNFELRKKYKIAYQHTFIEVDKSGEVIHRWSGGGVERLKKELGI